MFYNNKSCAIWYIINIFVYWYNTPSHKFENNGCTTDTTGGGADIGADTCETGADTGLWYLWYLWYITGGYSKGFALVWAVCADCWLLCANWYVLAVMSSGYV